MGNDNARKDFVRYGYLKTNARNIVKQIYLNILRDKYKIKSIKSGANCYRFDILEPYRFLSFFKIYKISTMYEIKPDYSQVTWANLPNLFYKRWYKLNKCDPIEYIP